jgi:hypothetical protein
MGELARSVAKADFRPDAERARLPDTDRIPVAGRAWRTIMVVVVHRLFPGPQRAVAGETKEIILHLVK